MSKVTQLGMEGVRFKLRLEVSHAQPTRSLINSGLVEGNATNGTDLSISLCIEKVESNYLWLHRPKEESREKKQVSKVRHNIHTSLFPHNQPPPP
jgi:hypothetical protein